MQRRQNQVSRLGSHERRLDGFEVSHLTNHDDVGVLSQHMHQRGSKRMNVRHHLLLHHNAALIFMNILDRILDRDDLRPTMLIDKIDHVIQGGGLSHSGRPRHQNQTARKSSQFFKDWRQPQFFS